jgi:hypothetical protein
LSTSSSLTFIDQPRTPLLSPAVQAEYSFEPTAPAKIFVASLVGMLPSGQASPPLFSWTWSDSFDGYSGGANIIQDLKNLTPITPANGSGGVTIISINGVLLPPEVSDQVSATASGLAYSRATQTFNGTLTLTNVSTSTVSGPLQVLLTGITPGVSLVNPTGNLFGTPYLTVSSVSLAPAQAVTVNVQFRNPSNALINFTPAVYSGSLN